MKDFLACSCEKRGAVYFYFVPLRLDYLNHSSIDMKKLLLISNSASQGQPYLGYAAEEIGRFLGPVAQDVLFVPYAAITYSWDEYVAKVNNALVSMSRVCTLTINRYRRLPLLRLLWWAVAIHGHSSSSYKIWAL